MTAFWLVAVLMAGTAVAFLLPSLIWRRHSGSADHANQNLVIARERLAELRADLDRGAIDEAEFEQVRRELEDSLLVNLEAQTPPASRPRPSRFWPLVIAVTVPAVAASLYLLLGTPEALRAPVAPDPAVQGTLSVQELLARLEDRLAADPDDERGWRILARSYAALQRFDDAVRAYERLLELTGDDPEVLVQLADALAMQAGGELSGRPEQLVERALILDPAQPQALWLGGLAAESRGDHRLAVERLRLLMPLLGDDQQARAQVAELIERAQAAGRRQGGDPGPTAAGGEGAVTVRVALDPVLAGRVQPDQTVYIFARAVDGPPMPLAVARRQVRDLPAEVELTDAMSMQPELRLSRFERVQVVARVSTSGQAIASSGDLEGMASPVPVASDEPVSVTISRVVP